MSEAGVDIRQLFRMMEEADETGQCWCGKQVGHAGWMDCLFGTLRVRPEAGGEEGGEGDAD